MLGAYNMRFKSAMASLGGTSSRQGDRQANSSTTAILDLPISETTQTAEHLAGPDHSTTLWAQASTPLSTRPSRASSIVSTRTRFSTNSSQDDARSIDIIAGGQSFRISRDASRITSDAPPPYSSYSSNASVSTIQEEPGQRIDSDEASGTHRDSSDTITRPSMDELEESGFLGANILDPNDIPSPVDSLQLDQQQNISSPYQGHRRHEATSPTQQPRSKISSRRTLSSHAVLEDSTSSSRAHIDPASRRRLQLSPLSTNILLENQVNNAAHLRSTSISPLSRESHSAGPALPTQTRNDDVPRSPSYIGRNASGVFPFPQFFSTSKEQRTSSVLDHYARESASVSREVVSDQIDPGESITATNTDTENDVSLHYTRMIRYIDREHRRALHLKDKELASLRERLNEVDTVYRQELRARDFIIDDLKKRLENLEESTETLVEKARNNVEDAWEQRWRDRDFHLRERMHRIEMDAQRDIERLMARLAAEDNM